MLLFCINQSINQNQYIHVCSTNYTAIPHGGQIMLNTILHFMCWIYILTERMSNKTYFETDVVPTPNAFLFPYCSHYLQFDTE